MDEKKDRIWKIASAAGFGVGGGVLMSAVILFLLNLKGLSFGTLSLGSTAVIACALPACFDFLMRYGYPAQVFTGVMVPVSFLICLGYAATVARNEAAMESLTDPLFAIHALSFVLNEGRLYWMRRRNTK